MTTPPSELPEVKELLKKADQDAEAERKVFCLDDFTADADEINEVLIPELGVVRYKRLTIVDLEKVTGKNTTEMSLQIICLMMAKANLS